VAENDPTSSALQRCVPILESRMRTMHEDLISRFTAQETTSASTNEYIAQLVTGRATLSLNICLNNGQQQQQSQVITTASPATPATPLQRRNHLRINLLFVE